MSIYQFFIQNFCRTNPPLQKKFNQSSHHPHIKQDPKIMRTPQTHAHTHTHTPAISRCSPARATISNNWDWGPKRPIRRIFTRDYGRWNDPRHLPPRFWGWWPFLAVSHDPDTEGCRGESRQHVHICTGGRRRMFLIDARTTVAGALMR